MMVSVGGGGVETAPGAGGGEADALLLLLLLLLPLLLLLLLLLLPILILPSSMRKLIGAGSHLLPRMKWWPGRGVQEVIIWRQIGTVIPPSAQGRARPFVSSNSRHKTWNLAGRAKGERESGERIRRWDTIK